MTYKIHVDVSDPETFKNGRISFANPAFEFGAEDPRTDLIWITRFTSSTRYIDYKVPGYSVEAHELGHILLDADHVYWKSKRNIMHGKADMQNNEFTPDQCNTIRQSPLIKSQ